MHSLKRSPKTLPKSISLKSPAKLNLYLRILNKRKDGFHNILTVFEKIDLCDQLILKRNKAGRTRIFTSSVHCPRDKSNLCYRAAELLRTAHKVPFGVDITIKKQIPIGAGLGGGSGNAAYALMGLNKLWGLELSQPKLLSYAKKLGSDVAFFMSKENFALATGRGDNIKPLKAIKPLWHVLVVPSLRLSSTEAYKHIEMHRRNNNKKKSLLAAVNPANTLGCTKILTKSPADVNILIHALRRHDIPVLAECLFNDFSEYLFRTYPGLFRIQDKIEKSGASGLSISGKGPALFTLLKSRKEALRLKGKLRRFFRVYAVKTFSGIQEGQLWR